MRRVLLAGAAALALAGADAGKPGAAPDPPPIAWGTPRLSNEGTPEVAYPLRRSASGRILAPHNDKPWKLEITAPARAATRAFVLTLPLGRPELLPADSLPITVRYSFRRDGWAHGRIKASLPDVAGSGAVHDSPGGVQMDGTLRLAVPTQAVRAGRSLRLRIELTVDARGRAADARDMAEPRPASGTMVIEQIRVGAA